MQDSVGDPHFPVWLVGDSPPPKWREVLETPLDPRHPARHSIWTSVLDYMQEELFRAEKRRFDSTRLYIRNAISDRADKPTAAQTNWPSGVQEEMDKTQASLSLHKPKVVLTFGAFAFEFLMRVRGEESPRHFGHWTTKRLGNEFRRRVNSFNAEQTNVVPLLHVSISRGKFLAIHNNFVGDKREDHPDYFKFAGRELAGLLLREFPSDPIWME